MDDREMKSYAWLAATNLHVADVAEAMRFYEVALGFEPRFVDDAGLYAELDAGGSTLALTERSFAASLSGASAEGPANFGELTIAVHDVDLAVASAVEHGATLVAGTQVKYWGQSVAYVRDLDGHLIQLCTPPTQTSPE